MNVLEDEQSPIGVIYGTVSTQEFKVALSQDSPVRGEYVVVEHELHGPVLGQVIEIETSSDLTFDKAHSISMGMDVNIGEKSAAVVNVLGFHDERGVLRAPSTPFHPGSPVLKAPDDLVKQILGLEVPEERSAYIGKIEGHDIKVSLDLNKLVQRHLSVIAMTGSGKSYVVGVLLEEFAKRGVSALVIDPHGEYTSLMHPNLDQTDCRQMSEYDIKPKGYSNVIKEYALSQADNPDALPFTLDAIGLSPEELAELAGFKSTGPHAGIIWRSVDRLRSARPYYTLRDVMYTVELEKNNLKWSIINSLEHIDSMGIFSEDPTRVKDLIKKGQVSVLNMRGAPAQMQQVAVTQLGKDLFEARKAGRIPPFMLVVEEAHNYCPQTEASLTNRIFRTLASEGRKFGLGLCIVSQRPAKVDKNVLSQCGTQVILKVTNPNDLKAVVASVEGLTPVMAKEVQRLPVGVAIVVGGSVARPIFVDIRVRESRHGGRSVDVLPDEPEECPEIDLFSDKEEEE